VGHGVAVFGREASQRLARVVEVPVRIVAGEAQRPGWLQALDRGSQQAIVRRFLERLGRPRDVVVDVLRRRQDTVRDLRPGAAPGGVEAPEQADERHESAFHEHHARPREPLEDAVAEDRREVAEHAGPGERVILGVEVGKAGGGHRSADADALEVGVDGDREPELVAGAPDGVVHGTAVRDARGTGQEHAGDLVASAEPPDLRRGRLGVLRRDDQQSAQPGLGFEPLAQQPVVVAATQPGGEERVRKDGEGRGLVGREDAVGDVERVEHLRAHGAEGLTHELRAFGGAGAVVGVGAEPARRVVPGI
jgi:hypothetical protein